MKRIRRIKNKKATSKGFFAWDSNDVYRIPDKHKFVGAIWYIVVQASHYDCGYSYVEYFKYAPRFPGDSWGTEYYEKKDPDNFYTRHNNSHYNDNENYCGPNVTIYLMSEEEFTLFKIRENIVDEKT